MPPEDDIRSRLIGVWQNQTIEEDLREAIEEFTYQTTTDSFPAYGYGFGNFQNVDFFDVSLNWGGPQTPEIDELLDRAKEIEKERRHKAFGKIWAHNTSPFVQMVPHLNLGLPVGQPIDLMKHTDVAFLKEHAEEIFAWFEKRVNEINLFYQKADNVPVIGAQNIKNIVVERSEEFEREESFEDLIELE